MSDVFLSYSREDQATARRFAAGLERAGLSVWWDQSLKAGEAFDQVTEQALREARAVVVLWSKHSVESRWVRAEATEAQASHRLVPVMIDACKRPIMFELTHTADLAGWNGAADDPRWRNFIDGLRHFTGGTSSEPAPALRRTRKPPAWIAAVLAAVVITAGLFWWQQGRKSGAPARTSQASIAVLPFDDFSSNKDQAYFADGVAEEILNQLARIDPKQLRVIARNSSFALRGNAVNAVGEKLGVEHVLEGSVRRDGEQLRITAQLINTKTDAHLWSKTYDRPRAEIFAVQEEIARTVAEALQVSLGVGIGQSPFMTRNVEAYDAYLEAAAVPYVFTSETQRRRIELLRRAVALDPSFAQAWVILSINYGQMTQITGENPQEWGQRAGEAMAQVERLFPDMPIRIDVRAAQSFQQGHWLDAERQYGESRVAALHAGMPPEQGSDVPEEFLIATGQFRRGIEVLEQTRARDPLNPAAAWELASAYGALGDFKAAFTEFGRGDALGGGGQYILRTLALFAAYGARDQAQIQRWLDACIALEDGQRGTDFHARLKPLMGNPARAIALVRETIGNTIPGALPGMAQNLAYFGDAEGAIATLRDASRRGLVELTARSLWYPTLHEARRLPAFKQLVRDLGLVDYWRATNNWGDFCKPTTGDDFECH